ncbi:N-formylglutamate amidohydrolase [Altererythrobacter sp.]|nr:N-formylglutamate amidohydrolase [Altererythrobacter sp.]
MTQTFIPSSTNQMGESDPDLAAPRYLGGQIPGSNEPAFLLELSEKPPLPVLIAAPHGGRSYPESLNDRMRNPKFSKLRLEDRYVDFLAQEVARQTGAALILAHAPRAMLDLNRAADDMDWTMVAGGVPADQSHSRSNRRARSGLGLIPRRLSGLGEVWRHQLAPAEVQERVDAIHEPYHRTVSETLTKLRQRWGAALLLDLHSMPPLKKRHDADQPAQFVIGDRFGASADGMLSATALRYFAQEGRRSAHNRPYAGGYVLDRHGRPPLGIHAIQIEVCRSLYLDARFDQPSARLPTIAKLLAGLVRELASEVVPPKKEMGLPLAAE